jgi:hypothetical protein
LLVLRLKCGWAFRAELVVRKLEKNWALQQWMGAQRNAMMRSIDCYERGYLFVDAQQQPWRILHMNQPASEQTSEEPP